VYIPLPNHLHAPWTTRAAERGKHVLCEKPIALTAHEAGALLAVRDRTRVHVQEAFMIRAHPQWIRAVDLVRAGRLGALRTITGTFNYANARADNIRNVREYGGGALLDIGCYLVHTARWIVGREPTRVAAAIERDPLFGVDRLTSMMLDFGGVQALGSCSTQSAPCQRVVVLGTDARLEIDIPFNAPRGEACHVHLDDGSRLDGGSRTTITVPSSNQYTLQGDAFSRAILDGTAQPLPLEDSVANMRVIDAVFRAAESERWEMPG
jgi:predicted dehydrogenase